MKRKLAVLLALLCLIALLLPGCKGAEKDTPQKADSDGGPEKTEPLRVLIDVEYGSNIYLGLKDELGKYMEEYDQGKKKNISFQTVIEDRGGPSDIEFEIPPVNGNDRDMYFTSLRTEIMAGGGPDVFVCMCGIGYHEDLKTGEYIEAGPLFNYPQQAMKRNMFLALDDYIEKAQFMEWDRLTPVIMDAGKTDKGRFLLPMSYTVPTTAFLKADLEHFQSKEMTWEEMLDGGPQMRLAAVREIRHLGSALAPVADYQHDKLAVSEEEMAGYLNEKLDNLEKYEEENTAAVARYDLRVVDFDLREFDERFKKGEPVVLVPLYSRQGGAAATIKSFAGINANTKRPEDAFFVLDYLLSEECQRSKLYSYVTLDQAVPTLEGLMTHGAGVSVGEDGNVIMPDEIYEQFLAVRDSITCVDFATPLDQEIQQLYIDLREPSDKSREKAIHDAYMRMNMMLAES